MPRKTRTKQPKRLARNPRRGPGVNRVRVAVDPYRPYRYRGVFIPFKDADDDDQWSSDPRIQEKGFIFVDCLSPDVLVVQSVETGEIFINKVTRADNRDNPILDLRGPDEQAEELRISTAPQAEYLLSGTRRVRRIPRTYFSELALWQNIGNGTYSLYFNYYNGGTLGQLVDQYLSRQRAIPEHFIWHVFLTLIEAVRYLHTGCFPDDDNGPIGWIPIHHRDIAPNNIFLHYAERPASEAPPPEGFQSNAFPEIVLGDFGHAAVEGDDPRRIVWGRWNEIGETAPWQDTYAVFSTVKSLCMCHIGEEVIGDRLFVPECLPCNEINNYIAGDDIPYSDELLEMLDAWEYQNCAISGITESQLDENGFLIPNRELIPDLNYMVDTVLPLARSMVRRYRRSGDDIPVDWYRQLDVSWTKPKRLLPYEWRPSPRDDEGENIISRILYNNDGDDDDSSDDDDGSHSDNDSGGDEEVFIKQEPSSHSDSEQDMIQVSDIKNDSSSPGNRKEDGNSEDNKDQIGNVQSIHQGNNITDVSKEESDTKSNSIKSSIKSEDDDIKQSGSQGSNNREFVSRRGDESGEEVRVEGSPVRDILPEPNLESHLAKLHHLLQLEEDYPDLREPCRLVMLEYGLPLMSEIPQPPAGPPPDLPDSQSSTSPDDGDDGGDEDSGSSTSPPSSIGSGSTHPSSSTDSGSSYGAARGRGGTGGRGRRGGRGGQQRGGDNPPTRKNPQRANRYKGSYSYRENAQAEDTLLAKVYRKVREGRLRQRKKT